MGRVLIVDDEKAIRITFRDFLQNDGHDVVAAETVEQAFECLCAQDFDVIVTDIIMPRMSGIELLSAIRYQNLEVEVILITGEPNIQTAIQAVRQGAFDYLIKPVIGDEVCRVVSRAIRTKTLKDENRQLWEINLKQVERMEKMVQKRTGELKASEEKFRTIFQNANDLIVYLSPEGTILEVNDKIEDILGYTSQEVIGKNFLETGFFTKHSREKAQPFFLNVSSECVSGIHEIEVKNKNGDTVFIESNSKVIVQNNQVKALLLVIRDISARKRAETLLLEYHKNLQSMASELALTEVKQRQIISSELHDRVGQTLIGTKIKVGLLGRHLSCPNQKEQVEEISKLIDQCAEDIWSLSFELCPPLLYEVGLVAALNWLINTFREKHGIECRLIDQGEYASLSNEIRGILFQAVRELLQNVAKHASANSAQVSVTAAKDNITVSVEDNGVGFDGCPQQPYKMEKKGYGLFGIRERVRYFNGSLIVDSKFGQGTRVTIALPR